MGSKAEQIRLAARELGPSARARDVIQALDRRGVMVTSGQVSTVLASMGKKRGRRRADAVVAVSATISLESLLAAKHLANQIGGVQAAKTAVDALAKLNMDKK